MKKFLTFFCLSMLMVVVMSTVSANAATIDSDTALVVSSTTQKLDNGDSIVTNITILPDTDSITTFATTKKTSGKKTVSYQNAKGKVLWSFTLSASYTYNGSSATCTSVSTSHTINDSAWKLSNITSSKSSNTAKASVTAKEYFLGIAFNTVNESLTLKCNASGKLS